MVESGQEPRTPTGNKRLAKVAVQCSEDTSLVNHKFGTPHLHLW